MSKKPVKDVFGFWRVRGAEFAGKYEIPVVRGTSLVPESLVPFSKCEKEVDTRSKAVHFYEFDEKFLPCLESEAKLTKKLETLRRYESVILPDFSVYRDMPLAQQIYQVYQSRAVGNFLMQNGIKIIPNVRWGDERSYEFAFDGIEKQGVVAVGVQGGYRDFESAECFERGFIKMLDVLAPETVLCYGRISEIIKGECKLRSIRVCEFPTEILARTKKENKEQAKMLL